MHARMVLTHGHGSYDDIDLELVDNDGLLILSDMLEDIQISVDREKNQVILETVVEGEDGMGHEVTLVLLDFND